MEYYKVRNADTGLDSFLSIDAYNELNALENFNLTVLETGLDDKAMNPTEAAAYDILTAESTDRPPLV